MNSSDDNLPIFTKTDDFLAWLIPLTNHFPRLHRHTITRRLIEAALDYQEQLFEANVQRGAQRVAHLVAADTKMNKVRHYLRLVERWRWISLGQYAHGSRMIAELGRMLGGWKKHSEAMSNPQKARVGVAGTD